jgi:uncharacterized HAD superfamily protein
LKIAFDIDGVLANFTEAYAKRLVKVSGKNRLPKPLTLPCWDWDAYYGYTKQEIADTIENVAQDKLFWQKLKPIPESEVFARIQALSSDNDVYFITNRFGVSCKQQTEKWLYNQGISYPTVIISSKKLPIITSLGIEFFVDDKLETMNEMPKKANFFLIDADYNKANRTQGLLVASDVKDALKKAGLW